MKPLYFALIAQAIVLVVMFAVNEGLRHENAKAFDALTRLTDSDQRLNEAAEELRRADHKLQEAATRCTDALRRMTNANLN